MTRGKAVRCYRLTCSRCSRAEVVDAPEGIDGKHEIDGWMYTGWNGWTCPICADAQGRYQCPKCGAVRLAVSFGGHLTLASGDIEVGCSECYHILFKANVWEGRSAFEDKAQPFRYYHREPGNE